MLINYILTNLPLNNINIIINEDSHQFLWQILKFHQD